MRWSYALCSIGCLILLNACQTASPGTAVAANSKSIIAARETSDAARAVHLKCGDATVLGGVWSGRYIFKGGSSAWLHTRLHITPTGPDSVEGVFEYIYGIRRGYERVPKNGGLEGRILADGQLYFGSWALSLEVDGSEHTFRASEKIAGQLADLHWSRSDIRLPKQSGCEWSPREAPLPETIQVLAPGPEVPPEMAVFSGIWRGAWGRKVDSRLVVRSISPDGSVSAFYSCGEDQDGYFLAGITEVNGRIKGDTLYLEPFSNGATVKYMLDPDGNLIGIFSNPKHWYDSIGLFRWQTS